jgi:hypothetical protein
MLRCLALVAVALTGFGRPAVAGEDDRSLSVSASYATFDGEEGSPDGAVLGLDYERGLSDSVWFRASAGAGLYCNACWAYSAYLTAGLSYALDVLKYVPYVTAGVGALLVGGEQVDNDIRPIAELGAGLDVLRSRTLSWGPSVRFEYFPGERAFLTAGLRLTWRWGFF